jgi:hypothetical protein
MSLTIAQKINLDGFVKPGELVDIRAGVALSLQDRWVFNALIEHAWAEIAEDKPHRIAMFKLRGPHHQSSDRVGESVRALMTTLVEVPTQLDGERAIFATQLLGETTRTVDESSPNAMLEYCFPRGLRRIIQDSRYWGRIKSHVMFAFSSKYSLALYEMICLRANLRVNQQEFGVEEFRAKLGVEKGAYGLFKNLKLRVLDPAVLEVNGLSDFNVEIDPIREGGMVRGKLVGFRMWWEEKSDEEKRVASDELLRSKVGRSVRLRGKVETISL